MSVKCVYGDNFFDITNKQIELLGQGLIKGNKQLVIVPDKYILPTEKTILQNLNLKATFNIEVVSFNRLASKILSHVQLPQVLSSLGATMVIEMILILHEKEFVCFKNTAKTIAFASIIYKTITQLKECKITFEHLEKCINLLNNNTLKLKLKDIALIYRYYDRYYEEFLSNQYLDANNKLNLLAKEIENLKYFENIDIHFCQFNSVTQQDLDLIKEIINQANSVSFGLLLPNEKHNNAGVYCKEYASSILTILNDLNVIPEKFDTKNTLPNFSQHILHNLMAINPEKQEVDNNKDIRIYAVANINAEVEWVAQNIMHKVKNGARFRDNVINCTNLEGYAPIFAQVFQKYNIPYWADIPYKLTDTEGCKLLLTALDCIQDNFQSKDVLRFAKNSLTGISLHDYAIFENIVKKYGIVGQIFIENKKPEHPDAEFDKYLEIKNFLNPLFNLANNITNCVTVADIISSIKTFCDEMKLKENLQGMALNFLEQGDLFKQSIAKQNYSKLENVLNQMNDILGKAELNFDQFYRILCSGITNITIAPLPQSVDCVYIGQNLASVFSCSPYYYIVGATEGTLPAWVSDAGLIADSDIDILKEYKINIMPSTRQINAKSKFNVLFSFIMAQKELMITYPITNGKDKCQPASVVTSLQKIFTFNNKDLPIISLDDMLQDDSSFGGQENRLSFLWQTKENILAGVLTEINNPISNVNSIYLATAWKFLLSKGYETTLNTILKNINNDNLIQNLKQPEQVFFTQDKAKVTQIEKFFECPYAHFLTFGLRLQQNKTAKPEAMDIGNILHAVFEKFGKKIKDEYMQEDEIELFVSKTFNETLKQKQFSHILFAGQNTTLLNSLKVEAVQACKAIQYQLSHSQYKIKFIETSFGEHNFAKIPEVAIINTNKRIKINGKIDRADVWGKRLRIIDYKTSKSSGTFSLLNFYLGKKIQLFYYMQAILSDLNLQAGGAYYLPVHREYDEKGTSIYSSFQLDGVSYYNEANMFAQDDQVSFDNASSDIVKFNISTSKKNVENKDIVLSANRLGATEEQFNKLLKYAKCVLEGAVNDIYDGYIQPLFAGQACDYCPYKYICKKDVILSVKERNTDFKVDLDSFDLGENNGV